MFILFTFEKTACFQNHHFTYISCRSSGSSGNTIGSSGSSGSRAAAAVAFLNNGNKPQNKETNLNKAVWAVFARHLKKHGNSILPAMAAANDRANDTAELIQNLPLEIQEYILKIIISMKIKERSPLDWAEVHDELLDAPYCRRQNGITKSPTRYTSK